MPLPECVMGGVVVVVVMVGCKGSPPPALGVDYVQIYKKQVMGGLVARSDLGGQTSSTAGYQAPDA